MSSHILVNVQKTVRYPPSQPDQWQSVGGCVTLKNTMYSIEQLVLSYVFEHVKNGNSLMIHNVYR